MTPHEHIRPQLGYALRYLDLGWRLCQLRPNSKAPMLAAWNSPDLCVKDAGEAAKIWSAGSYGMGLVHGSSKSGAFDVDSVEWSRFVFGELGVDFDYLMAGFPRIKGRDGRDKIIFSIPGGGHPPATIKLVWPPSTAGGRPVTVFELRGDGGQDVLPPSIHPDTGKPYEWVVAPWDECGVPECPKELWAMWRHWGDFKSQFEALCPWAAPAQKQQPKPKPAPAKPMGINGLHGDVIGRYCAQADLDGLLERHGYKPIGRKRGRWLAPTSSSGIAGVNLLVGDDGTERIFSHHASDPLNDGHAHDAFSLLLILEHGGDMRAAIIAAASAIGEAFAPPLPQPNILQPSPENPRPHTPQKKTSQQHPEKTPKSKKLAWIDQDYGLDVAMVPGILGGAVEWINDTAKKPQPSFAVSAALAFGSAIMGRRYVSDLDNWPAFYFLGLGKSGCGKEHPMRCIEDLLWACGQDARIGPGDYTSDAAVVSALISKPAHVALVDEIGMIIAASKDANNHLGKSMRKALTEAWGRCGGRLVSKGYSDMGMTEDAKAGLKNRFIWNPSLSIFSMTTPDAFFAAISSREMADGFLNRFLVVEADNGRAPSRHVASSAIPQWVVDWGVEIVSRAGGAGGDGENLKKASPIKIPIVQAARDVFSEAEAGFLAAADDLEPHGLDSAVIRSTEMAMRLALVAAVSSCSGVVGEGDARWAVEYVRHHTRKMIDAYMANMFEGEFHEAVEKSYAAIAKAGEAGLYISRLGAVVKNLRDWPLRRLHEVAQLLIDSDRCYLAGKRLVAFQDAVEKSD